MPNQIITSGEFVRRIMDDAADQVVAMPVEKLQELVRYAPREWHIGFTGAAQCAIVCAAKRRLDALSWQEAKWPN